MVAGHEIIGTITQLGSEAKGLSIGQRVGIAGRQKVASIVTRVFSQQVLCNGEKRQPLSDMQVVFFLPIKSVPTGNG